MTVSSFIKKFSAKTWSDIRFTRKNKKVVRLGEVTITENLILSIAYQYYAFSKSVYLFEAVKEDTNGNDIELFIRNRRGGFIAYPCQAKIVDKDPSEIYSKINHSNSSVGLQIDALINYGRLIKGLPIYLFYNYSEDSIFLKSLVTEMADSYGCSYVPATFLRHHYCLSASWKKPLPKFKDLHPFIGKPFYRLFELGFATLQKVKKELTSADADPSGLIDWSIKEYSLEELQSSEDWKAIEYNQEFVDLGEFPTDSIIDEARNALDNVSSGYSSRYRIVIDVA